MTITFNHTIIAAIDRAESAEFFCDILGAREAPSWGPFTNVQLDDGVLVQFAEPPLPAGITIQNQHYAFLVDDDSFDRIHLELGHRKIEHWADPQRTRPGETNTDHGGRGVYFLDPSGHFLEVITRPYI